MRIVFGSGALQGLTLCTTDSELDVLKVICPALWSTASVRHDQLGRGSVTL